ncbi:hypothetical protein R1sor_000019 [Riccia sorocarpa]|uniref:Phosphatidylinositol-glycan biosynthesis class X protein n=1 Tax=Riccia sorocarpa TaxID=122646 RepID=A0ABD3GV03_9MARC
MKKTFVFILVVFCILSQERGGAVAAPVKFQGHDLCILEEFHSKVDKVAISDIQVEDIQFLPLGISSANLVSHDPKASVDVMRRNLLGSGAHRELETDITIKFYLEGNPEECDLILFEKLSNGVFADPFQLQRLQGQGAFNKVHIYGDTDLERPARVSYPSVVEVHTALVRKGASADGTEPKEYRVTVSLPLHARYPQISEESHFQLNITMPQTLQWYVPAGSPLHSTLVDSVTTAAALLGVLSVFLASKKST